MKWRFLFLSTVLTLVGVAILVALDYFFQDNHTKAWHYLCYHLGALFASIGSVGIGFELLNRSQIGEEWIASIRHAFAEDPQLAKRLNDQARQDRVRFTLEAQLDKETGDAIFFSTVLPYMERRRRFREQVLFELHLQDLDSDVVVAYNDTQILLDKDQYHRLLVKYRFRRPYDRTLKIIGCILLDDYDELTRWFGRSDTLYREVACLEPPDAAALVALLNSCANNKEKPSVLEPIFKITVRINDIPIRVTTASLSTNGKSIAVTLAMPVAISVPESLLPSGKKSIGLTFRSITPLPWDLQQVDYCIEIEALRTKAVRRLPLLLPEPTANPVSLFTYPASVRDVVPAPFFGGEPPFAKVEHDLKLRQIRVEMPPSEHEKKWVFPPAGVIFTWNCP